ncbi:RAMP superfamily CRISPR-associated protein [uncultured Selenomonas sp.]|uniref:RAMP superfamily CRISPR-associated protein n=1 Tax=uncultured Selenomonas sp. TaxID=159275 RepID=UPI002638C524|nr:RAMP superfamily CRISPR-associated protein [uncultured Selenomonas sp.]
MMTRYTLRIEALSPLALTSGKADVTLDSAIVHDKYGIPLFPAKRLRGLLYESAVEVAEMAELSGRDFLTHRTVAELFRHGEGQDSLVRLSLHDLHPEGYEELSADLAYLMARYEAALSPLDVLEEYTTVRFQTEIDKESGTARDNSLHNMQAALADDLVFSGEITLTGGEARHAEALALACANLRTAGLKRNRGFGKIRCTLSGGEELLLAALGKDVG